MFIKSKPICYLTPNNFEHKAGDGVKTRKHNVAYIHPSLQANCGATQRTYLLVKENDMGLLVGLEKYDKDDKLICEVAFWHKVHFIHNWFCENTDYEEWGENVVTKEQLKKLLEDCKVASLSADLEIWERLFPCFDHSEYKTKFKMQMFRTIDLITKILNETDFENETIKYYASY